MKIDKYIQTNNQYNRQRHIQHDNSIIIEWKITYKYKDSHNGHKQ